MGGETTHSQKRDDMWMSALFYKDTCYNTLSHASACAQKDECTNVRENTRVRVFCSHPSTVTVDRYQL